MAVASETHDIINKIAPINAPFVMKHTGFRLHFTVSLALCVFILATALYMEFAMHMDPCMLCMGQRFIYVAIAFVSLLAMLHNPMFGGHQRYGFGLLLLSLLGMALAARQLYLQALPEAQVPACGPSFSYMVDTFPLTEVLSAMVQGSGSCATVQWSFLGLSIAGWSLIMFAFLGLNGLHLAITRPKNSLP